MDARIEVQCRTCGRVQIAADAIDLVVDRDTAAASYGFTCPGCDRHIRRPANKTVVRMLELGGVAAHPPLQHPERLDDEAVGLPPFTLDDLLDFHELLQDPHWHLALAR